MKSSYKPSTSKTPNMGNSAENNKGSEQASTIASSEENDCNRREYAGIDMENIRFYAEHEQSEDIKYLTEEACNVLAEDINYKLRMIIYESITRARLTGRNVFTSEDVDETFSALGISKVLGAPNLPIWVNYGNQNLIGLDDVKVNLVEKAESDQNFAQSGDVCLIQEWHHSLENSSKIFKNYFKMSCEMIVSPDRQVRKAILKDLGENVKIGPIAEWFYNFGYLLLAQDIKYKDLTLFALELMEKLETSPITSISAPDKLLKLLVQLIIQRLLNDSTDVNVLKPMASVLAILCIRPNLFQLTMEKIHKKLFDYVSGIYLSRIILIVNTLGISAICRFFIPNVNHILKMVEMFGEIDLSHEVLASYGLMCKERINDIGIQNKFYDIFGDALLNYWSPINLCDKVPEKEEMNFIQIKVGLIKNRRKLDPHTKNKKFVMQKAAIELRKRNRQQEKLSTSSGAGRMENTEQNTNMEGNKLELKDVFDIPEIECTVTKKFKQFNEEYLTKKESLKRANFVLIGRTSLLLPVLNQKRKKILPKCLGHILIIYNI